MFFQRLVRAGCRHLQKGMIVPLANEVSRFFALRIVTYLLQMHRRDTKIELEVNVRAAIVLRGRRFEHPAPPLRLVFLHD